MKEAKIASLVSLFPLPQYVVVLEDVSRTHLVPIWIGVNEGNAIALEMNGEKFPRPLTHDLMVNMLHELGATVSQITITDIKENSYYAEIRIAYEGKEHVIDARPSDSLALAVRIKCPIFIADEVLNKCPQVERPITTEEVDRFKEELKTLSPDEFFRKLESTPGKKKEMEDIIGSTAIPFEEASDEEEEAEEDEENDEGDYEDEENGFDEEYEEDEDDLEDDSQDEEDKPNPKFT